MNIFKTIVKNLQKYVPINVFRGGQKTFYQKIRQAIIDGHRTMYIEGPTGMGKSFIQATLSDAIINGSEIKILLLVPKINLLSQMKREFVKFAKHLLLGLVGGRSKDYSKQVTVMTYQSFINISNEVLAQFSVLFLDEAHKGMGEKTRAKIDEQKHAIVIGFTATSYYDEVRNLKEWLGLEVYKVSIPEAVSVGMISSIQFMIGKVRITIQDRSNFSSQKEYKQQMGKDIIRQGGNIAAVRLYTKLFKERGIRFIMFTVSVEQGTNLVEELRSAGISAEIIHAGTKNREELFRRFRNDEFKVLIGIDVIKEGFDDAGVHGSLFAYPIGSIVGLVQGGGRATRIDELVLDKVAYIVQLMFEGKNQVWYSDVLEGNTLILGPSDRETEAGSNMRILQKTDLAGLEDDVIESVEVESEDVLRLVREYTEKYTFEEAPEGWMTPNQISKLAEILGGDVKIKEFGDIYRKEHPEWFGLYMNKIKITEFYHPDLVSIIKQQCQRVPSDWYNAHQICKFEDVQGSGRKIAAFAENYRQKHPDWFRTVRFSKSSSSEYYHPDLVVILRKLCVRKVKVSKSPKTKAPKGWLNIHQLYKRSDIQGTRSKVRGLIDSYRAEHPEWFHTYPSNLGGRASEHYHPDLIAILRKLCVRKTKAPEGWFTISQILRMTNVSVGAKNLKIFLDDLRKNHNNWFKVYNSKKGNKPSEHFHPDLVSLIENTFRKT